MARHGPLELTKGPHTIASGATLTFPAGSHAPHVEANPVMSGAAWTSPLLQLGGRPDHALAATYGVLLATVLGAMGLPHILVRFYTNRDGQAARRTTAFVLLLLGCFYIFPAVFAVLGRMEAPGLYTSGQTDSVVLVLPRIMAAGSLGVVLGALVAAGAFAAFLSTSSGLLISMSGALSHDIMGGGVRAFRISAIAIGIVMTALGLAVLNISINVLVGWAFAIAASTFCPLLLLGIWWRRFTWIGAVGGLILGGLASSIAVLLTIVGVGSSGWPAVLLSEPAIWTVPLAFVTMIVLSLATPRRDPGRRHAAVAGAPSARTGPPALSAPDRDRLVAQSGVLTELEALEDEGRRHGRTDQGVAPERARRLPDAGVDDELGRLTGRHVGPEDLHVAAPVGPLAPQLERIAVVEVPQLGGVHPVRRGDLALQEEVVDGAAGGPCRRPRRRPPRCGDTSHPRDAAPGRGRRSAHSPGRTIRRRQAEPTPRLPATARECAAAPPKSAPSVAALLTKRWQSCSQVKPMPPKDWMDSRPTKFWQSSAAAFAMETAVARSGVSSLMAATAK